MILAALFVAGLLLAAAFDWVAAYAVNAYRLETKVERRQAFVVCFALHGPWFALGLPAIFGGYIDTALVGLGRSQQAAWFLMLPLFGVVGGISVLLVRRIPAVRAARAAVWEKMRSAQRRTNVRFGALLGVSSDQDVATRPEIDR